jgi:hypothetical protein
MTPRKKLDQLCRRHGLPRAAAESLMPLVERALSASSPELRLSLLNVVENSLARRALERERQIKLEKTEDYKFLKAVAQVLHTWDPTAEG